MFCVNCGAKLPDNVKFCTYCGQDMRGSSVENKPENAGVTLRIVRADQWYAVNPPIQIMIDGAQTCYVENGSSIDIPVLPGMHNIVFSFSIRKKAVNINITKNTALYVKFNRITGSIQVEDYVPL